MTYQEYLELKAKRAEKLKEGEALLAKKDFDGHKALMGEVSKMNQELDGLRQEYILFQNGEDIFLIELAVFTGDEGQEGLLQVMLDTFTVF